MWWNKSFDTVDHQHNSECLHFFFFFLKDIYVFDFGLDFEIDVTLVLGNQLYSVDNGSLCDIDLVYCDITTSDPNIGKICIVSRIVASSLEWSLFECKWDQKYSFIFFELCLRTRKLFLLWEWFVGSIVVKQ